jgi:hypothetical protein
VALSGDLSLIFEAQLAAGDIELVGGLHHKELNSSLL